jgi:transposase
VAALRGFATGLRRDQAAVAAALAYAWRSGQVEGQVNKLKRVKRGMFGRAGFACLRRRFLLAG